MRVSTGDEWIGKLCVCSISVKVGGLLTVVGSKGVVSRSTLISELVRILSVPLSSFVLVVKRALGQDPEHKGNKSSFRGGTSSISYHKLFTVGSP